MVDAWKRSQHWKLVYNMNGFDLSISLLPLSLLLLLWLLAVLLLLIVWVSRDQ